MKEFTEEELAQYNGKNGNLVYVVYKGKVYDVSASFLWKDGIHQVLHSAGVDLTDALSKLHTAEMSSKSFPWLGSYMVLACLICHLSHEMHACNESQRKLTNTLRSIFEVFVCFFGLEILLKP